MKRVDAYLTRKVQSVYPDAVVYKLDDRDFAIEKLNGSKNLEIIGLGSTFQEAKASVDVLVKAVRGHKTTPAKSELVDAAKYALKYMTGDRICNQCHAVGDISCEKDCPVGKLRAALAKEEEL